MQEIQMKVARTTFEEIEIVMEFFRDLESILEHGCTVDDDGVEFPVENDSAGVGEWIRVNFQRVSYLWPRVLFNADTMLRNFADLESGVLAWRPEIIELHAAAQELVDPPDDGCSSLDRIEKLTKAVASLDALSE